MTDIQREKVSIYYSLLIKKKTKRKSFYMPRYFVFAFFIMSFTPFHKAFTFINSLLNTNKLPAHVSFPYSLLFKHSHQFQTTLPLSSLSLQTDSAATTIFEVQIKWPQQNQKQKLKRWSNIQNLSQAR